MRVWPFDDAAQITGTDPVAEKPYIKSAQFCGECHDATSPNGVRREEAFSEWQRSPSAKSGIACQHCHMGPVQGIPMPDHERPLGRAATVPGVDPKLIPLRPLSDHTTPGPDYSLLPELDLQLTGTERFHVQFRPLGRKFTGGSFYQFSDPEGYVNNATGAPDRY